MVFKKVIIFMVIKQLDLWFVRITFMVDIACMVVIKLSVDITVLVVITYLGGDRRLIIEL